MLTSGSKDFMYQSQHSQSIRIHSDFTAASVREFYDSSKNELSHLRSSGKNPWILWKLAFAGKETHRWLTHSGNLEFPTMDQRKAAAVTEATWRDVFKHVTSFVNMLDMMTWWWHCAQSVNFWIEAKVVLSAREFFLSVSLASFFHVRFLTKCYWAPPWLRLSTSPLVSRTSTKSHAMYKMYTWKKFWDFSLLSVVFFGSPDPRTVRLCCMFSRTEECLVYIICRHMSTTWRRFLS